MPNYDDLSREKLVNLLLRRDAERKHGIVWEKEEIETDNKLNDKFVALTFASDLSCGDAPYRNLIIEGDNWDALRHLRMTHSGRVKCIYIDPPYNTGKKDFVYNDTFIDPENRFRHSLWLDFMFRRLSLAKDLLTQDGVIFVSIGDDEVFSLGMLMAKVFGEVNKVGVVIWKNATDNNPTRIATEHEYVVCFARDKASLPPEWKVETSHAKDRIIEEGDRLIAEHRHDLPGLKKAWKTWFKENKPYVWPFQEYDDIDFEGPYTGSRSVHNPGKEGYRYDVPYPRTGKPCTQPLMGYRFPKETMDDLLAQDRIIFGKDESKVVELKVYAKEYRAKLASVITLDGRAGVNELKALFPEAVKVFNNPKPTELIKELLSFVTKAGDLVLDFFAGSGSTGHAVLSLNAEDGGNRTYILVSSTEATLDEPEKNICRDVCAERMRRVVERLGLGPGFAYLRAETIAFENIYDDLTDAQVWTSLQLMHGLPLAPHDGNALQVARGHEFSVALCEPAGEVALEALKVLSGSDPIVVYSWTPGVVRDALPIPSVEPRQVPEALTDRFRA